MEAKLGGSTIRIEYPPEVEALIKQHHETMAKMYAEIDGVTGINEPSLQVRARDMLQRPYDREAYIQKMRDVQEFNRMVSNQLANILARYAPTITVFPDPQDTSSPSA